MGKMINEEELMHYGVMGMRWGVRRASKRSGGSKKGKKKKAYSNHFCNHSSIMRRFCICFHYCNPAYNEI